MVAVTVTCDLDSLVAAVRSVCATRPTIYRAEFQEVLVRLGIPELVACRDDVFQRFDEDGNGVVSPTHGARWTCITVLVATA